jgi:murein DD-endopeptidase MepM/ murein hydrolase activator NlpD
MLSATYRYDPKTCRYELTRPSWFNRAFYLSALLTTAMLMCIGLLVIHDLLHDSEAEKLLRKENVALRINSSILTAQLENIENTLGLIQEKDNALHQKFFASVLSAAVPRESGKGKQHILLADANALQDFVEDLNTKTDGVLLKASRVRRKATEKRFDGDYTNIPTIAPVETFEPASLLSGFGMRINPYHKGLYQHQGIDIAVPRGTAVVSVAAGRVITVKNSSLQAGYGNYVEVDHGNGFVSRYAHLEEMKVKKCAHVEKGFVIGTTGNSGGSVAPHLHFEILRDGKNINPAQFILEHLNSDEHEQVLLASNEQNQSLD